MMRLLIHILMNVIIYILVGIHSICKSNCIPSCPIMGVFYCIVFVTTSDVVPRVSHRQPVQGEKFQRRIKFNQKIMGFVYSYFFSFNRGNMNGAFIHFILFI